MIQGLFATCAEVVKAAGTGYMDSVDQTVKPDGVVFMTKVEERSYQVDYIAFTLKGSLDSNAAEQEINNRAKHLCRHIVFTPNTNAVETLTVCGTELRVGDDTNLPKLFRVKYRQIASGAYQYEFEQSTGAGSYKKIESSRSHVYNRDTAVKNVVEENLKLVETCGENHRASQISHALFQQLSDTHMVSQLANEYVIAWSLSRAEDSVSAIGMMKLVCENLDMDNSAKEGVWVSPQFQDNRLIYKYEQMHTTRDFELIVHVENQQFMYVEYQDESLRIDDTNPAQSINQPFYSHSGKFFLFLIVRDSSTVSLDDGIKFQRRDDKFVSDDGQTITVSWSQRGGKPKWVIQDNLNSREFKYDDAGICTDANDVVLTYQY
jgi:hypothetical protein